MRLLLVIFSNFALAQVDPSIQWKTLETEHFEIIYAKNQKPLAKVYAYEAEKAFADLKPVFHEMTEKTIVVIIDNTDATNGYANFLPFAHVVVYPVLPNDLSSINYYDNWAREMIIHELTHVASFQPSHGFYTPLKWIFGTIVRPNAILPRWFLEGIAVQIESRYSKFGRLNSPWTSATLRAMVRDQELEKNTLAHINEVNIPSYPYGRRPYLFGSLLWQEMLENSPDGLIERLHQRQSRRLPFFLNSPMEEETQGQDYEKLLHQAYKKISQRAQSELETISKSGNQNSLDLSNLFGATQIAPAVSPNGQYLVYVSYEKFDGSSLQLVSKPTNSSASFKNFSSRRLTTVQGTLKIDWHPQSQKFVFDKIHRHDRYYFYFDLFEYNLSENKTTQLTFGARAREASYSPSGRWIALIQADGASTALSILDTSTKTISKIFQPPMFNRLSSPIWLNESIVGFVGRNKRGLQQFYIAKLNQTKTKLTTKPFRKLTQFHHFSQPLLTKAGLLFVSDDTGVPNLYRANKSLTEAHAISNSPTAIINGTLDPQTHQLIISQTTGTGAQLVLIEKLKTFEPPKIDPRYSENLKPLAPTSSLQIKDVKMVENDFWGIEYLLPRYWVPFIFPVEGGAIFQANVMGQDPLAINSYFLNGSFDTVTEKGSYGMGYLNRSLPTDIYLSFAEYQNYLPGVDVTLTNRSGLASLTAYIPGLSHQWRANVGYVYDEVQTQTRKLQGDGPTAGLSYVSSDDDINESANAKASTVYSINHTQYADKNHLYEFGKTTAQIYSSGQWFLPTRHSFEFHLKGSYASDMKLSDTVVLGDKTVGGNYLVNIINSSYIMRGYPTGAFSGRNLVNTNMEYHFPVSDIYKGNGLFPLFFNNLTAALFVDGVTVDGAYLNSELETYRVSNIEDIYWSTGIDFYLNTTLAYHLPVTFNLGLYYGFTEKAGGGFIPFISLGYTGHGGVDQK